MALMAAHGEITPMPVAAVFADTQAEPPSVYRWLEWLEKQLPFPVHRVTAGNLERGALEVRSTDNGTYRFRSAIPFFMQDKRGDIGRVPTRNCTIDYKVRPLTKEIRKIAGIKRGQRTIGAVKWIGISLDEINRCKPSTDVWCETRWPLIDLRMRRNQCINWMAEHGYPTPPRSACWFCPHHNSSEWRNLQKNEPEQFEKAVEFEQEVQRRNNMFSILDNVPFLSRKAQPLDSIDFRSDIEHGQQTLDFQDECEGVCGV